MPPISCCFKHSIINQFVDLTVARCLCYGWAIHIRTVSTVHYNHILNTENWAHMFKQ